MSGDLAADRPGETPVTPKTTHIKWVTEHGLDQLQLRLRPPPRVERDRDPALEKRLERCFDEPFGATIGSVILADDGESHGTPAVTAAPSMRGTRLVSMASGGVSCIRGRYQRALSVTNVLGAASQGLLVDKVARLLCLRT